MRRSFRYAVDGLRYALRTQPNLRIHLGIATGVIVLAFLLEVPAGRAALLMLAIAAVIGAELMNTAVEALVDLIAGQPHPQAQLVKDVAAAAVLVTAIGAALSGLWVLGPPLATRLGGLPR